MHILNKIERFDSKVIDKIIAKTFNWCILKWGHNNKKRNGLMYTLNWSESKFCGEYTYWKNTIEIWPLEHKNIGELIETVIHEFTHYKQSMNQYEVLYKTHTYTDHPYEIEANRIGKENRLNCWRDIKSLI